MEYKIPLYIQLKQLILERIADGEYLPGEKIPSEREMAATYKINRMTVKNAVNSLVEDGILYKEKNVGVFVCKKKANQLYTFRNKEKEGEVESSFSAKIQLSGQSIESEVLEKGMVSNRKYVEYKLGLDEGESAYALHRLRKVNRETISLEYCYVPAKFFPDIDDHNFEKASLYAYMEKQNHLPIVFEQKMIVEKARRPFMKPMGLKEDDYVYALEFIGKDAQGNIVEYTQSYLKCDYSIYQFLIESK